MEQARQIEMAHRFYSLHHTSQALVLANCWDAVSARIIEQAGFPATATGSAGLTAAIGYPDGERAPRSEVLEAVARIVRVVSTPVTADLESGYGATPEETAKTIRLALEAGVVGVNLEDSAHDAANPLVEIDLQVEKIQAARRSADAAGIPLYINARTDVFMREVGPEAERLDHALQRARAYLEAGADGIFYVDVIEPGLIATLVRETPAPVNILAGPGAPSTGQLEQLGVRRISTGQYPMRATLALIERVCTELRQLGTYTAMQQDRYSHSTVNRLFDRQ